MKEIKTHKVHRLIKKIQLKSFTTKNLFSEVTKKTAQFFHLNRGKAS